MEKLDTAGSKEELLYHVLERSMPTSVSLSEIGDIQENSQRNPLLATEQIQAQCVIV